MNILIPMAGYGTRFTNAGYTDIKPLIDVAGKPMIQRVLESIDLSGQYIFVINSATRQVGRLVRLLRKLRPTAIIIDIDYLTGGPASTCMLAQEYIDNDLPLVIFNSDQIMTWDTAKFLEAINTTPYDGIVVTYPANTEKNSYVRLTEDNIALEFAEKQIISEHSLNGIHFWKHGSDFVSSAQTNTVSNGEYYVSTTFNGLVQQGKKITIYEISPSEHWAVGTPEDLQTYLEHNHGSA